MTQELIVPVGPNRHRAKKYAAVIHGAQTYNDEIPYTDHLDAVVDVLGRFGVHDEVMTSAAYLHDSIEDTRTSYSDIRKRFGTEVAELVYAVTSELGRNRKERNAKTYPKIAANLNVIALKLADRIANVEYGLANGGKFLMYAEEFPAFREALTGPGAAEMNGGFGERTKRMWEHLSRLLRVDLTG